MPENPPLGRLREQEQLKVEESRASRRTPSYPCISSKPGLGDYDGLPSPVTCPALKLQSTLLKLRCRTIKWS